MMRDAFVLIVSDRPAQAAGLARGIERVMACTCLDFSSPLPQRRPLAVVIDLGTGTAARAEALAARLRERPLPTLVLTGDPTGDKRAGADGVEAFAAQAVLPAATPRETVLARILEMIEGAARATAAGARRLDARAEAATGIVTDLFFRASADRRLRSEEADRGTETVLAAVSESGIRDWLDVVWRHDAQVYQHTLSVAGYAASFGAEIGLGKDDHHRLTKAALLHDIGKSRIPAPILNKPNGLNPEEAALMRSHAVLGAELLRAQGDIEAEIIDVVRHHHEKLDGSGYPDGLAGAEIADLVRMVTICDIFSALTERRAYRGPLAATEAVRIMTGMRGQLDRTLLNAFAPVIARSACLDWC
ncbi:putative nucleotidyltransferase with HDIG domain [Methylobacterium sp. BE186]|uniref:HD-GYP domain-containing protein n=1 Tax=Methylobacterium sp. BE186 TaxID=2817715 RepID=UPI0028598FCC|nr:HD domain-containing phosphohydrolase [Methylobacterium sp. BE186]MDR7040229.1 putative nucleotidyltransferase with HDIG domain [Methylobacterium sp. BE186]